MGRCVFAVCVVHGGVVETNVVVRRTMGTQNGCSAGRVMGWAIVITYEQYGYYKWHLVQGCETMTRVDLGYAY
jgi:hypothetical protein